MAAVSVKRSLVDYGVLFWINLPSSSAFMIMIIIMIIFIFIYYYYYRAASIESYVQSVHKSPSVRSSP